MEQAQWEPLYWQIIEEFGFSPVKDEEAARLLDRLITDRKTCTVDDLRQVIREEVTVCGDAPALHDDVLKEGVSGTVIAADGATSTLLGMGIVPDIIVTDLDGNVEDQIIASAKGAMVVVHAHGDNMDALSKNVPRFPGPVMGTTQVWPFGRLHNFGGFTDGDRAVIMARHLGAARIKLLGFDFDSPRPKKGRDAGIKRRKLAWARRLIFDMEGQTSHR